MYLQLHSAVVFVSFITHVHVSGRDQLISTANLFPQSSVVVPQLRAQLNEEWKTYAEYVYTWSEIYHEILQKIREAEPPCLVQEARAKAETEMRILRHNLKSDAEYTDSERRIQYTHARGSDDASLVQRTLLVVQDLRIQKEAHVRSTLASGLSQEILVFQQSRSNCQQTNDDSGFTDLTVEIGSAGHNPTVSNAFRESVRREFESTVLVHSFEHVRMILNSVARRGEISEMRKAFVWIFTGNEYNCWIPSIYNEIVDGMTEDTNEFYNYEMR